MNCRPRRPVYAVASRNVTWSSLLRQRAGPLRPHHRGTGTGIFGDPVVERPHSLPGGTPNAAPGALESVAEGCDGAAERRPSRAPCGGCPGPPARCHRSRNLSNTADPGGPCHRVAAVVRADHQLAPSCAPDPRPRGSDFAQELGGGVHAQLKHAGCVQDVGLAETLCLTGRAVCQAYGQIHQACMAHG